MKTCIECGETLGLDSFYAHPRMADGHLNKCKECIKKYSRKHYQLNIEHYSKYDQLRTKLPDRLEKKKIYRRNYRDNNPEKYRAHMLVASAIRSGQIDKKPCEICGATKVEAHHDDYTKPLNVKWFCFRHHREVAHSQRVTAESV